MGGDEKMDEELMNEITEEKIEVSSAEIISTDVQIEDEEYDISTVETESAIEVVEPEVIEIEVDEAMGWVGGDSERHYSLLGRNDPNQHEIEAITGLREELDEIERLKTVYSDKFHVANYYEWNGAAYDEYGYFVSVVPGTSKVQICNGSNIFGVSVNDAGFIGGQDVTKRDNTYGLIVTSGLVDVRCELDVQAGDYVVCNTRGYAKKSGSNYGYKVLATADKSGVWCGSIVLGVQADVTDAIGEELNSLTTRVGVNEKNITSAVNVANQAYNKSVEAAKSASVSAEDIKNALEDLLDAESTIRDYESVLASTNSVATQAKAIANAAAVSAAGMRDEAVEKAKSALDSTTKLRENFETQEEQIKDIEDEVSVVTKRINGRYAVVLEVIGNKDPSQIYYQVDGDGMLYHYYVDEDWDSCSEWNDITAPSLDQTTVYYVPVDKTYWYYNYDIGQWVDTKDAYTAGLPVAIAGVQNKVDDNSASINSLTSWQGVANISMARIEQKADANGAYIQSTVANIDKYHVGKNSQAYGFTLEQAAEVLEEDQMYYVPIEETTETYKRGYEATNFLAAQLGNRVKIYKLYYRTVSGVRKYQYYGWSDSDQKYQWITVDSLDDIPDYTKTFIPGYLYKWGRINGVGPYGWTTVDKDYVDTTETVDYEDATNPINTSSQAVYFSHQEIMIDKNDNNNNYGYWFTQVTDENTQILDVDGNPTTKYAPNTLYKWDLAYKYQNEDGNDVEEYCWNVVDTLASNSTGRAVSQIRQDANKIAVEVTNATGALAGIQASIDDTSVKVESVAAWPSDVGNDKYNMAILKQHSDGNSSHLALAAIRNVSNDVNSPDFQIDELGGAKIVLADDAGGSYISVDADRINFGGNGTEEMKFQARNIDFTAGDFTIDADRIRMDGELLDVAMKDSIQMSVQAEVDNIEIGGRNLAHNNVIAHSGVTVNNALNDGVYGWNITKRDAYAGTQLKDNIFTSGETYTLSYFFKGTSGTLKNIGGHSSDFTFLKIILDGKQLDLNLNTNNYGVGIQLYEDGAEGTPFKEHYIALTFLVKEEVSSDENFYIQPNRGLTDYIVYDLWNIKVEKGNMATDWTPAPEDQVFKNNIISSFNMTPETIKMSADHIDFTAGDFTIDADRIRMDGKTLDVAMQDSINITVEGFVDAEQTSAQMNWKMLPEKCVWWNQNTSETSPLMRLDDSGLYIKGEVDADGGHIGGWDIGKTSISSSGVQLVSSGGLEYDSLVDKTKKSAARLYVDGSIITTKRFTFMRPYTDPATGQVIDDDMMTIRFNTGTNPVTYISSQLRGGPFIILQARVDGSYIYVTVFFTTTYAGSCSLDITYSQPPFLLLEDGTMYANAAQISGNISADGSKIGGWEIRDDKLRTNNNLTELSPTYLVFGDGSTWPETEGVWAKYANDCIIMNDGVSTNKGYVIIRSDGIENYQTSSEAVTAKWGRIIDVCQTCNGSDLRIKNSIEDLDDKYNHFFDLLAPKRYKYNAGTSDRYHTGFIAQEVVASLEDSQLDTKDFAAVMLENPGTPDECWYLRRDEFVALNTWQIQKLKTHVNELEEKNKELEERLAKIEALLSANNTQ